MIANLRGRLSAVEKNAVVVEVGGIGLRVYVPETFAAQCGPGGSLSLGSALVDLVWVRDRGGHPAL